MRSRFFSPVYIFLLFAFTAQTFAGSGYSRAPQTAQEFCENADDPARVKAMAELEENRLSFRNHGGFAGGGVCWWHSRFQRNALYLTLFRPELPKPSEREVKKIIQMIAARSQVVEIPGYRNLLEFSQDWEALIQHKLEVWQITSGLLAGHFADGLHGRSSVSPEKLQSLMDALYERVENRHEIVFQVLQFPGIVAHAWLVVHMRRVSGGYDLDILDSNTKTLDTYEYRAGMSHFSYFDRYNFVPYTYMKHEYETIQKRLREYCASKT